jgi:hypothetical protein
MTLEIFRIAVDLLAPGAIISTSVAHWYGRWDDFHSNRILFPVTPDNLWYEHRGEKSEVKKDMAHIRITAIGTSYTGLCNGAADFLLSTHRLDYFLGNELARIVQTAIAKSPPYKYGVAFISWLELWEVDEEKVQGKMVREITDEDLKQLAEQPDVPIRTIFQK